MNYFGISKEFARNLWKFDVGLDTYIDSYNVRSYTVFTDITHQDYRYGILAPSLNVECAYKGKNYTSSERQFYCFALPQLRIGKQYGLFANLFAVPRLGSLTNGFVGIKVGYKW